MDKLKPLKKKILRSRIDGANFTALIPFNPDDFQLKESFNRKCPENSNQIFDLNSLIKFYEKRILSTFSLPNKCSSYRKNGLVICEVQNLGVYCDISRKSNDLMIQLQFKGLFFTQDDAFQKMKLYLQELVSTLDIYFRLTLIDIAKDITLRPWEVLPYRDEQLQEKYLYNFRYKIRTFSDNKGHIRRDTGFELAAGRFKLKVYDKRHENDSHKNPDKRAYYANLYKDFIDDNGELLPISRFELTLRQEYCYSFSDLIYDLNQSEDIFIQSLLHRFSKRHSLRTRPTLFKESNPKRRPITENGHDLFSLANDSLINIKTPSLLRTSNPQKSIDSSLEKLAEALYHSDELYADNPDKLKETVSILTETAIKKGRLKKFEHEKTKREQDFKIRKIRERFQNSQLDFLGDDL